MKNNYLNLSFIVSLVQILYFACSNESSPTENPVNQIQFPVAAQIFVQYAFERCEGIAFNGEGELFVSGNAALWHVDTEGNATQIAQGSSNLGLAPIGNRDILYADFGPTNAFDIGYNRDGVVWRVTPEGTQTEDAGNMGDPNFILVLEDGSYLVSDDATDEIHKVSTDGSVNIFTQLINHPNGLALSPDGTRLYVAQMFQSINPITMDGRIWSIPFANGELQGNPEVLVDLGANAANDGLAIDTEGRIYVACWNYGQIIRIDPNTGEQVTIARNMPGVASLAFGRGEFDNNAIYATSTLQGVVWKVDVGIEGAALNVETN
ncbi:SMP-30/gluconolactonase/LRE family protein [Bacteroidota bacterium]